MKTIRDIPKLDNVSVLVRTSLNVPVKEGTVTGTYRLRRALPTIEYLRAHHARVILIGHIGEAGTETLEPVYRAMKEFIPQLVFCPVTTGAEARAAVRNLPSGGVLMLENLRRDRREVMNDESFARELAELADVFVEDSFDVCHRVHASVVGVPTFLPAYAGLSVEEEVRELSTALRPRQPSLAIIGGAKFSTKEPVLRALLKTYTHVFVGGALANDFMQAKGLSVGSSLVSGAAASEIKELLKDKKLLLPLDYVVAPHGSSSASARASSIEAVKEGEAILDNGPETVKLLESYALRAKTILWNGPLGNYENGFTEGTESLARAIAQSRAHTLVGGGDTVAAVEKVSVSDRFSFISTGGGAMLDFLAKGTLPGIEVLGY